MSSVLEVCAADPINIDNLKQSVTSSNVNEADENGFTPLHWAVARNSQDAVAILLQQPTIQMDAVSEKDGSTPLHWAANFNYAEIVQLLLSKGANVTILDKSGKAAKEYAKAQGVKQML